MLFSMFCKTMSKCKEGGEKKGSLHFAIWISLQRALPILTEQCKTQCYVLDHNQLSEGQTSTGLHYVLLSTSFLPTALVPSSYGTWLWQQRFSPRRQVLNDTPQGLTGTEYLEKELSEYSFCISQGLWQWGQFATCLQYNISKRRANASWNSNVPFDVFHTTNSQLNYEVAIIRKFSSITISEFPHAYKWTSSMDLVPHQHQLCCEPRQQGPVLLLLPALCICYYTSSSMLHSTGSGAGILGCQGVWQLLWDKANTGKATQ